MTRSRMGMILALSFAGASAGAFLAYAAAPSYTGKLSGYWMVFSGMPGDTGPPTKEDTKILISVEGKPAAEMYRQLGPAVQEHNACGDSDMHRRRRGEIDCTRRVKSGEYACYIGMDLRKGTVWGGTAC